MELLEKRRLTVSKGLLQEEEDAKKPRSEVGLLVSKERYWREYYNHPDFTYEWNNGYLEEKPVSKKETKNTFHWFEKVLAIYLEVHPIAEIYGLETGFELQLPHKTSIRRPDLGIIKKNNPVPFKDKTDNYSGIFDLCIEAISDSNKKNIERDTKHKKEEYEEGSVSEYYILDGLGNNTHFYTMNQWGLYEEIKPISADIIVSRALPGFQFRISDLYRQPPLSELVEDEVYQGYVMLKYQAERKRAEIEKARAERERERAEREKARAEREKAEKEKQRERAEKEKARAEKAEKEAQRLMALLRQLGISPDG